MDSKLRQSKLELEQFTALINRTLSTANVFAYCSKYSVAKYSEYA